MKFSYAITLLLIPLVVACGGDPYKRVYDNIKNREDNFKSPGERALTPTPNYEIYRKEREVLKHKTFPAKEESPVFNLKPDASRKPALTQPTASLNKRWYSLSV